MNHPPGTLVDTPADHLPKNSVNTAIDSPANDPLVMTAPLTRQNLKQFTRSMAGPGTTTKSGTVSDNTAKTKESNTTPTTTNPALGEKLICNNVQHINAESPERPTDYPEYKKSWQRARDSPEPDPLMFQEYKSMVCTSHTKGSTHGSFWPFVAKNPIKRRGAAYYEYRSVPWSRLKNEITTGLRSAKPDVIEALLQQAYPKDAVGTLDELYPGQYGFVMPSFAMECNPTTTGMEGARMKCAYNGALMVHSALHAHLYMYGNLDDFYGKAKAITIAFNGENVEYFLHHATSDPQEHEEDCRPIFHQSRLGQDMILDDEDDFKQAWKHVRNAQDMGYALAKDMQQQLHAHYDGFRTAARAARAANEVPPSNAPPSPDRSSASDRPCKRVKVSNTEP